MPQRKLFIFLLACFCTHSLAQAVTPIHHIYFDLKTQTYQHVYSKLKELLERPSTPKYNPTKVIGKFVLGQQRRDFHGEPPRWIYIHIEGVAKEDKVTLAIAIDDLYLLGFSNATNHWYKFSGGFQGLPAGAIKLPIGENYRQMIEGGHKNLWKVPLGKQSAIHATKGLARYDSLPQNEPQLKDGLVRCVVMFCEAMRFKVFRDTFSGNNWDKETFISEDRAKYVVDWGSLSTLLILWDRTKHWGVPKGRYKSLAGEVKKNSNVNGMRDAWNIVDFLLRPKDI
jgi:hypothetical protein